MKLELGKTYINRRGEIIGPLGKTLDGDKDVYPYIYLEDTYTVDGNYSINLPNDPRDLIALHEDQVNSPSHYTSGGIECIDAIRASLTPQEFRAFLKGNAIKYIWRYEKKENPQQDLEKAQWYLNRLLKELTDADN